MRNNIAPDLGPTELMKAMGAPSWNPIPPDQTKWPASYKIPLLRLWSYMCDHSIRKGRRKGYVCDDHGNPVRVEDAARSLQMDPGFCRRLFSQGIALGLWRRGPKEDGAPKIILNGRVVKPAYIDPEDRVTDGEEGDGEEGEQGGEARGEGKAKQGFEKVCTDLLLPPYIRKQLKGLPAKKRGSFLTVYAREFNGERNMQADLVAANRLLWSPRKDKVFGQFGIAKIHEVHKTKDGKPREPRPLEREMFVQAVLPGLEAHIKGYVPAESVQTFGNGRSVQSQNHSVQTTFTGHVQTPKNGAKNGPNATPVERSESGDERAILEPLESSLSASSKRTPAAAGFLSQSNAAAAVSSELGIDDDAAQRLLAGCKAVDKNITAAEIVELARLKIAESSAQIRKGRISNVTGLLIKHLPLMCSGSTLQTIRTQIEEQRQERAQRVQNARAAWPELSEYERQECLQKYPELQKGKAASGDD